MRVRLLTAVALLLVAALPLAAQPVGHLFQQPADHVVLATHGTNLAAACAFYRVMSDGSGHPSTSRAGGTPFEVPEGRLLVITDVEWVAGMWQPAFSTEPAKPLGAGMVILTSLTLQPVSGFGGSVPVFQASGVVVPTNGREVAGSEHLTAGVTVAAGTPFCLRGQMRAMPNFVSWLIFERAILRGYLIDAS